MVADQQTLLLWLLPVTALLVSAFLYPMIISSVRHMSGLRKQFEAQAGSAVPDLPPIHGQPALRRIADLGYLTIPLVLSGAWLVLLLRLVFRSAAE